MIVKLKNLKLIAIKIQIQLNAYFTIQTKMILILNFRY